MDIYSHDQVALSPGWTANYPYNGLRGKNGLKQIINRLQETKTKVNKLKEHRQEELKLLRKQLARIQPLYHRPICSTPATQQHHRDLKYQIFKYIQIFFYSARFYTIMVGILSLCYHIMIHGQHLNKTAFQTPLFKHCLRAQPFSQSVPTWYLMLENQQADMRLHNYNLCKYFCPIFFNQTENCCFVVMEGEDLDTFITAKLNNNQFPILTEQEIWSLIICVCEGLAYLKQNGCQDLFTHLKQYSIRKIASKKLFKLVFHQSMVSQLNVAKSGVLPWHKLYLSPEELNGEFIPEKSIVFSFGSMLLHLCAFQDRNIVLYANDKFVVDESIIASKLAIARQKNGYSRLLCNFIQQTLEIDHEKRFDFYQLRQAMKRKLERQYNKQSDILSQIMELQKGKSVSYEINIPIGYQFSSKSPAHDHNRHTRTRSEQIPDKFVQEGNKLQQSNVQPSQERQQRPEEDSRKIKKKAKLKFEGSKVGKSKNEEKQSNDKKVHQASEISTNLLSSFDYRGTFGARNISLPDQDQIKMKIKKQKTQSEDQQNKKQALNQSKSSLQQIIDQKDILESTQKKNKYQNIKVQIPTVKYGDNPPHQDVQTPKGFGRQLFNSKNIFQDRAQFQQIQINEQIPQLMTTMKYLNLDYCLKPVEELAREMEKTGVWVQGDLYYGDFRNGRRVGLALQIFTNGEYYYGFFKEDLFCGEGFYFWNSRQYFFGKFSLGQKVFGRLEGEVQYQGGFKDNKRSGSGTCWYSTGEIYSGNWLNGKKHGRGLLLQPDGSKFVGNWVKGKRKGQGFLETQLMTIKGIWNDQQIEGLATIEYKNGDSFEGKIGKTLQKINGKYASKSGRVFVGDFENDMPRRGELLYSNGDKYIGQLKNLRRHGYGQYYYISGQVYKGQWQNNAKKQ